MPSKSAITSGQMAWVASAAWGVALGLIVTRMLVEHPKNHSVYVIYADAGRHWLHGEHLYDWQDAAGYRYSPLIAAMFAPMSLLPDRLGGIVWRLLNAAVYLAGLAWCCRIALPTRLVRQHWATVLLLVAPLSIGSINSGQASCLLIGLLLCAIAAVDRRRWNLAAACVALAVLLKLYPIAVGLLLVVLFPRRFTPRLIIALAIGLALPLILQRPSYAWHEYADWMRRLGAEDRTGRPLRSQYQDLRLLMLGWRVPFSSAAYLSIRLLAAAAIAAICAAARYTRRAAGRWPRRVLLGRMLAMAGCWMTVLGPSTESSTYILIAPALAWAMLETWHDPRRLLGRAVVLTSFGLFIGTQMVFWFPIGRDFAALGTQVIAGLLLLGYLLATGAGDLLAFRHVPLRLPRPRQRASRRSRAPAAPAA